jgi:hypothetical protein
MNTQKIGNSFSNAGKKVSNVTAQGVQKYKDSSTMGKVIFLIILVLFIAFIIYIIYYAVKASQASAANSPVIVNDVIDAYVARPPVPLPQVTQGMNQSFSTWIYVKDWNYRFGQYKNILWKGNPTNIGNVVGSPSSSNNHCPSLWLYPLTNSLKVVTSTSVPEGVESCDIQNIPLMAWVHIVYVLNNRTVDTYINGKLERSCALRGIPTISNDPVYITYGAPPPANSSTVPQAGFYGKIGNTIYYTYALLPNQVANLYQKGPLGTSQYQIQFFQNGQLISINSAGSFANSS